MGLVLSINIIKEGDIVIQGQMIGLEGGDPELDPNPGASTGDHLHFGMMDEKMDYIDPKDYLLII